MGGRKKEGFLNLRAIWINLRRHWSFALYLILALREMYSHGGTIITFVRITSGRG
jgi:hypothetical protein